MEGVSAAGPVRCCQPASAISGGGPGFWGGLPGAFREYGDEWLRDWNGMLNV